MAANYLTVNTQFNPYTLQEMLVPYQMYGEEYRRREDLQNQYSDAADVLGAYLDMERDREAYAAYNAYKNALDAAAADLSTNGLSAANRKSLNNLRRRYNTEITPISAAIESRQNYIKDYDALRAKDPTLLSSINPSAVSVDAFLNGKTPDRLDVYGSQIYSRMEAQAKAASQRMQYDPQFFKAMGDQYWTIKQRKGFNSQDTQRFLQDMMSIPELGAMINSVMQSTGAYNLPEAERNKAFQYAVEGTLAGMTGDIDYGFQDNKAWSATPASGLDTDGLLTRQYAYPIELGLSRKTNKAYNKYKQKVEEAGLLKEVTYEGKQRLLPPDLVDMLNFLNDPDATEYVIDNDRRAKIQESTEEGLFPGMAVNQLQGFGGDSNKIVYNKRQAKELIDRYLEKQAPEFEKYAKYADDLKVAAQIGVGLEGDAAYTNNYIFRFGDDVDAADINNMKKTLIGNSNYGVWEFDPQTGERGRMKRKNPLEGADIDDFDLAMSKFGIPVIVYQGKTYTMAGDTKQNRNAQIVRDAYNVLNYFGEKDNTVSVGPYETSVPGIGDTADMLRYEQPVRNKFDIGLDIIAHHPEQLKEVNVANETWYVADIKDEIGVPHRIVFAPNGTPEFIASAQDKAVGGNVLGGDAMMSLIFQVMRDSLKYGNEQK